MSRVLVVSLDGYERSIEEEMIAGGHLPALARLRKRSARFLLDHGSALRTGLGAEHVSSGLSPVSGNRWSALDFDKDRYEVVQEGPKFCPFASVMSAKTVVFDLPYFDLQRAPNVQGISAWGAHDAGTELSSSPVGLVAQVLQRFGHYPAEHSLYTIAWPSEEKCRLVGNELVRGVELRTEIASWLLNERVPNWNLALIGVSEAHSVLEALWHGYDTRHPLHCHHSGPTAKLGVVNVYKAIDRLVDRLASEFDDAEIVIFSMHGMGANTSDVPSMVLLPELLYRHAFSKPFFEQPSSWTNAVDGVPILGSTENWHVETKQIETGRHSPYALIGRFVPPRLKRNVKRAFRIEDEPVLSERRRSVQWMPAARYRRAWPRMHAFALPSYYDGRVRINLKGRERNGLVPLDKYEDICSEITTLVSNCKNPISGQGVVESIDCGHPAQALDLDASAADMTIVWKGTSLAFDHPTLGKIGPVPFRRVGGHTGPFGMAYIAADRIKVGDRGTRSSFDVVPTLFDLLDEPLPHGLSGRSLLEI